MSRRPAIVSSVRRLPDLDDSTLIHADMRGHEHAPHSHDGWTIGLITGGANRFIRDGRTHVAVAGTICVVNPGEVHTGGGTAMRYRDFMPAPALLARLFPNTPARQLFLREAVHTDASVRLSLRRMFHCLSQPSSALQQEQAVLDALATLFGMSRLHPHDAEQRVVTPALQRVRDVIDAHPRQRLTLSSLAKVADLSPFHLCRSFTATYGLSPAAHVRNRRVQRAAALVRRGVPLATAAIDAGFCDQAQMTRQFRAVLGVTPGQWRG